MSPSASRSVSTVRVGYVGAREDAERLAASGLALAAWAAPDDARALVDQTDLVVVGASVGERFEAAQALVSEGQHVFLAWPPGVSTDEAKRLAARAEEAGVEVGAARPLPVSGLLRVAPPEFAARLVTVTLVVSPASPIAETPWPHRIAGALDVCATLARTRDAARLDAQAERDGGALRTVAFSVRFRTGAYAQATLRTVPPGLGPAEVVRINASGPGRHVSAQSFEGPLCVEGPGGGRQPVDAPDGLTSDVREALAFVDAVAARRRAPFGLADALATMRLAEAVGEKLRA